MKTHGRKISSAHTRPVLAGLAWLFAAGLLFADEPAPPSDHALPDEPPAVSLALTELAANRPKWLLQAERLYDEGIKAQEAGNTELAGKRFKAALRLIARKIEVPAASEFKDELGALFAKLEEQFLEAPRKGPPEKSGLDVTEQELEAAPVAATPAPVEEKSHTIPIDADDPLVKKYVAIYSGPRKREMEGALQRLGMYKALFLKHLKEAGLPRELIYLPVVESECRNVATSHAGAVGLWQLMAATARHYKIAINYWVDEPRDPEKATRAAVRHLKELYDWFQDWHLSLAAYNRGGYGVERDMKASRSPDFAHLAKRRALPNETEHYVPKFMAVVLLAENPERYGLRVEEAAPVEFDEVSVEKPLDLKVAAECAGTTEKVLQELNPTLRLWCTPKSAEPFKLRIPKGTQERFTAALAKVKDWTPSSGEVKYRVKKGDVLGNIAKRYKTTVKAIQQNNRIRDPRYLRPGQVLVIRPGRGYQGD